MKSKVCELLVEHQDDNTIAVLQQLHDYINNLSPCKPFSGLETEYLQSKYFKESLSMLVSFTNYLMYFSTKKFTHTGTSGKKAG